MMVVVVEEEGIDGLTMLDLGIVDSVPLIPGPFLLCDPEPFQQNVNSVPHSAGIVLSIWQATVPKLIPMEFRELTGFCRIPAGISGGQ